MILTSPHEFAECTIVQIEFTPLCVLYDQSTRDGQYTLGFNGLSAAVYNSHSRSQEV